LPAEILKGRVVWQVIERENPKKLIDKKEEEAIHHIFFEKAKGKVASIFSQNFGILPKDLKFINVKIIARTIDGYVVPSFSSFEGKNLGLSTLVSFLPQDYLEKFNKICETLGFKNQKIVHLAECVKDKFSNYGDGIFIDIGGETTQIFILKDGKLEGVSEFSLGGKTFSDALSEKLGLMEEDARIFKEKYGRGELSLESAKRVEEILYFPARTWFESFKKKLKEVNGAGLFPVNIFLFGGGCQLPEVKDILVEGGWGDIAFVDRKPKIKIFKNPQFTPALLLKTAQ